MLVIISHQAKCDGSFVEAAVQIVIHCGHIIIVVGSFDCRQQKPEPVPLTLCCNKRLVNICMLVC